jgi:hypothetical protein
MLDAATPKAGTAAPASSAPLVGPKAQAARLGLLSQVVQGMADREENPDVAAYRRKVSSELSRAAKAHAAMADAPGSSVPLTPESGAAALPVPGTPGGSPPDPSGLQ